MVTHKIQEMTNFNEWAKDKSPLLSTASLLIAGSVKNCLEFLETVKAGKRIEGYIDPPNIQEWLSLYLNPKKVYQSVIDTFRTDNDKISDMVDFYEFTLKSFRQLSKMNPDEINREIQNTSQEKLQEIFKIVGEAFNEIQEFIMTEVISEDSHKNKGLYEDPRKRNKSIKNKAELIFFIRVWIPCILFYGDYPENILSKAQNGDEDALENLIRLDKSVIHDPKIMEIHHKAAVAKKQGKMDIITKAMNKTPKMKIDPQKVKYSLAGLISLISIALGNKLTAVEIHKLFDAIAYDTSDENIDPDLILPPETFEKAIQRARTFWQAFIPLPDKK